MNRYFCFSVGFFHPRLFFYLVKPQSSSAKFSELQQFRLSAAFNTEWGGVANNSGLESENASKCTLERFFLKPRCRNVQKMSAIFPEIGSLLKIKAAGYVLSIKKRRGEPS